MVITDIYRYLMTHVDDMRADLRELVEIESPSDSPANLDECARYVGDLARRRMNGRVHVIEHADGSHLDITVGELESPSVLMLGHFDTVWPIGTLAARPYDDDGERARGPGVFDMKAGLIQGIWAVRALQQQEHRAVNVRFFLNSDEEVQSRRSRSYVEAAASAARVVFVLEPSLAGALKTSRKGVGRFSLHIRGRAAHAGIDPRAGISAVSELAHAIEYVHALTNHAVGTTVNVGVVSGGTRANVVAEEAHAAIDVRVVNEAEAARVTRLLLDMSPTIPGIQLQVSGKIVRPPMPRTPAIAQLFELAATIASGIGIDLAEAATGGGSDGNFCAALGIPVLDGLGAVGDGAHATTEYVSVADMPRRAALVAGMIHACSTSFEHDLSPDQLEST
jgi:glutamate carboxypeptidase